MSLSTEGLWRESGDRVRAYFRRRLPQHADDLVQETYLRAHQALPALRDPQAAEGWLFAIARRVLADELRRKSRAPGLLLEEPAGEPEPPAGVDPELIRRCVVAVLEVLPAGTAEALRLAELEGLKQAEVARRLGISLSGAKSRIQRGRRQAVAIIEGCAEFERDGRGRIVDVSCRPGPCFLDGCS